jgi:iron complex transport system substrate-binding protein
MARQRWGAALVLAACLLGIAPTGAAPPPGRAVSMNLCTDQLAMLLARPGQLVAVSPIARDPVSSAMWRQAAAVPTHAGSAEAILGLAPDLVLAGAWDSPATLAMLRRLGIRVETFPVEKTFADVEANITRMGELLGTPDAARRLVAGMRARLTDLPAPTGPRPRAALYYANGYTSGSDTLADAILTAAGLDNIAADRGLSGVASLPLEILVTERPDLIVLGQDYAAPARAQGILHHPALRALDAGRAVVADNLWVCGTPMALDAVAALRAARPR